MNSSSHRPRTIPYMASLIGGIRQILTGLQGFDSMAREIIQNADDAEAKIIRFDIDHEALLIWNNATFVSCGVENAQCKWETDSRYKGKRKACDFHAISNLSSSNKYQDPSLIGRFGIGFVSVYQITDTPIIRSQDIQLELNPLQAENNIITIEKIDGSEFKLPWAFESHSPIRSALSASALTPNDIDVLQRDLISVADDCLLFLRNLTKIEITRDGKLVKSVKKQNVDDNKIRLSFAPEKGKEDWFVIHANAEEQAAPLREKYPPIRNLGRQTDLQIAFRLDKDEPQSGKLFAYLPTEQASPVPCHINADFFPEQNRKALVLSGEQHERYWNEMLLDVSATEIANHLVALREVLGPQGLWRLIGSAFEEKNSPHFGRFWNAINSISSEEKIVWCSAERWEIANSCRIGSKEISNEEEQALTHISLDLIHSSLRPYQNALQSLGAKRLTLASVVEALEIWDEVQLDQDLSDASVTIKQLLIPLWSITNSLVPEDLEGTEVGLKIISRLKQVRFAPQHGEELSPIDDLYRLPPPITNEQIKKHISTLPLVEESFSQFTNIHHSVDLLTFSRLLSEVATRVTNDETAATFFGTEKKLAQTFYKLLSIYPRTEEDNNVSVIQNAPILAAHNRFLTPSEAVLPGGFEDPVGRFNTLDISYYDDRSQEFLRDVLGVQILTLKGYILNHLSSILEEGITDAEYVALIEQLTSHIELLHDDDVRKNLIGLALVKTLDGNMHQAKDCYFKTPELIEILGDQPSLWADTSLFDTYQKDSIKAFLSHLGLRAQPSLEHALDRIDTVVEHSPSAITQAAITNLLQFVFQAFEDENIGNREGEFSEEINRLQYTDWLPANVEGALNPEEWYAPHELYQPFRSGGFESQVPVLAIRPFPKKEFLDFLEMPAVPETSIVVDHLIYCAESGKEVSDYTYQILNDKLREEDDLSSIEKLISQKCVYSPKLKAYLSTTRIFWSKPRISYYCFQAPDWMHRYKELFDFLGVMEEPSGETFAGVLEDIAKDFGGQAEPVSIETQIVHELCMNELASEIREHPKDGQDLLNNLSQHPFLITIAGSLAFCDEVAVRDNDWLVEAFGDELNGLLIHQSPECTEVIDLLNISRLSSVTAIEAVRLGEEIPDKAASLIINERLELLVWLFSSFRSDTKKRIYDSLKSVEIVHTDFIRVRSVFSLSDPSIVSIPKNEQVLFDKTVNKLYLHLDLGDAFWTPALRAMISTLVAGDESIDVRQSALNASNVLLAPSYDIARQQLEQAGFSENAIIEAREIELDDTDLGELDFADDEANDVVGGNLPVVEEGEKLDGDGTSQSINHDSEPTNKDTSHSEDLENSSDRSTEPSDKSEQSSQGNHQSRHRNQHQTGLPNDRAERSGAETSETNPGARRTEWMRSYVAPLVDEEEKTRTSSDGQQERNMAIDDAAMKAVIEFETDRQCSVERMPHLNPGYDVISIDQSSGKRRLIEVKGLDGEWTERGVKLTRTQIMNAEEYGDEFWLYVVEHARDDKNRSVYAINNPFFKAKEFWFDDAWKKVVDEKGGDLKSRFIPGKKVRVKDWGLGTITAVDHRGIASNINIDFQVHGEKNFPLNLSRMHLVED
jgi:hypothetical protein